MALSTNRTLITQTGINTHQVLNVGGLDSAGIATFSNFKTGFSNVHSIGFDVGSAATIRSTGNASFTGVVTALKFVGDISEATGAAAGLGTALSQTQTDPLNKVYYTNKVLSISTTTTIDHPATANLAYTQYGDIKIENGHDLIVKNGDDFKYDILGISTTKLADNYFRDGLTIGIGSSVKGNLIGNVTGDVTGNVTGNLTGNVTGNINNSTLLLQTGNIERLRISPEGYVTKPYQPSFSAYINGMTSESSNSGTQTMPFNATYTNVGGHFKTTIYKFIAPVAGNYFFSLSQNHSARVDTRILKNGNNFHGGESETTNQSWWDHHHLSCVIPLAVGDKVHCETNNQDGGSKRAWNSSYWDNFSGFLIG